MARELVGALGNILEHLGNRRTDDDEITQGMQITKLLRGRNKRTCESIVGLEIRCAEIDNEVNFVER